MGKAGNIFLEGEMDFDRFIPALREWFDQELADLGERFQPNQPALMMALPVWGREYIDTFTNFCIPTLLSPSNIQALVGRTLLVLHTSQDDFDYLLSKVKRLEDYRFELEIRIIPQHLLDMVPERTTNKYWLLGTCQHFYLKYARHKGMGFHMLMPDHVYSNEFFPNLLRLADQHDIIAQTSMNVSLERSRETLEAYRYGEFICIDPVGLTQMAFDNLHDGIRAVIMNGRDIENNIPVSNFIMWKSVDAIYAFSPHASLLYLSPRLLENCPMCLHNALDTGIPYFAQGMEVYVPTIADNMSYVELSHDSKQFNTHATTLVDFCLRFWVLAHFNSDYLKVFALKSAFPILPDGDGVDEKEVDRQMSIILEVLKISKEEIRLEVEKTEREHDEMAVH